MTSSVLEYLELCSESIYTGYPTGGGGVDKEYLMNTMVTFLARRVALRSLKVRLDNTTFCVVPAWKMPHLTNLSVVSSNSSYVSIGFTLFFLFHGPKLLELELLGHSSSLILEHYLTSSPLHPRNTPRSLPPLADRCPNLTSFICSADSEWDWQIPNFIAPTSSSHLNPTLGLSAHETSISG